MSLMVILGVLLRFVQETRADAAAEKLKAMINVTAAVVRAGKEQEIPLRQLVPGDVVTLSAGDMIPADVRLITANDLFVSQGTLTGESLPEEKLANRETRTGIPQLEISNICFLGTSVESGAATAVILTTPEAVFPRCTSYELNGEFFPMDPARTVELIRHYEDLNADGFRALQHKGHVVGFMGDGINDAPALHVADVGISVDSAVDIAKAAASMILLEKDLMVMDEGVIEGRKVFVNILKYVRMGACSNFGNMFSVLGASAFLPFVPMAPIQVLTNNLLYDFSQILAICTDTWFHCSSATLLANSARDFVLLYRPDPVGENVANSEGVALNRVR